jgi:hypothetical protein
MKSRWTFWIIGGAVVAAATVGAYLLILARKPGTLVIGGPGYRIWQVQPDSQKRRLLNHLGLSNSVGFYRYTTSGTGGYSIIIWQERWNSASPLNPLSCNHIIAFDLRGHTGKLTIAFPSPGFPMLWVWNSNPWQGGAIGPLKIPDPSPPLGSDTVAQISDLHGVEGSGFLPPVGRSRIAGLFAYRFGKSTAPMIFPVSDANKYPFPTNWIPACKVEEQEIVTYIRINQGTMREAGEPVPELHNGKVVFIRLLAESPSTQPITGK